MKYILILYAFKILDIDIFVHNCSNFTMKRKEKNEACVHWSCISSELLAHGMYPPSMLSFIGTVHIRHISPAAPSPGLRGPGATYKMRPYFLN
jgi:hypothetical protein